MEFVVEEDGDVVGETQAGGVNWPDGGVVAWVGVKRGVVRELGAPGAAVVVCPIQQTHQASTKRWIANSYAEE